MLSGGNLVYLINPRKAMKLQPYTTVLELKCFVSKHFFCIIHSQYGFVYLFCGCLFMRKFNWQLNECVQRIFIISKYHLMFLTYIHNV